MSQQLNTETRNAAWGGTLLSVIGSLGLQDMVKTIILAVVGTTVSFLLGSLLKKIADKTGKK